MAVATPTNLTKGGSTTDATSIATASVSFTANRLYILTVNSRTGITADPNQPTASGGNVTWVVPTNGSEVIDTTSSSRRRLTVLYGICSSTTTGAVTIDFGGQSQESFGWIIDQIVTGFDRTTPIVQAAKNNSQTAVTSITATLAAFGSANNATYGVFGCSNGTTNPTAGTGFTTITNNTDAGGDGNLGLETEFRADNDTTVDFTFSSDSELGCVGVEIKGSFIDWSVSSQIQSDHTKVSGASDLTNFPVLIKDGNIPASVYSAMQSAGQDLRITTDSAGTTEIPFEIVSITPGSSLAEVWAKVPTLLTASATSLYLWSGNASAIAYDANAPFGSQAVWSSNYKHINHLNGNSNDSTSNALNGTDTAVTYSTSNGKFTQGAGYNGSTSYTTLGNVLSYERTQAITYSFWIKHSMTSTSAEIIAKQNSASPYNGLTIEWNGGASAPTQFMRFALVNTVSTNWLIVDFPAGYNDGAFHKVDITYDGSSTFAGTKGYVDGTAVTMVDTAHSLSATIVSTYPFQFGARNGANAPFNGNLDDIRVKIEVVTADWISTEYANQNDPSTFWSEVSSSVRHLGLLGVGT